MWVPIRYMGSDGSYQSTVTYKKYNIMYSPTMHGFVFYLKRSLLVTLAFNLSGKIDGLIYKSKWTEIFPKKKKRQHK